MAERSQDDDRNMLVFLFDVTADIETVIIPRARHTNHQSNDIFSNCDSASSSVDTCEKRGG